MSDTAAPTGAAGFDLGGPLTGLIVMALEEPTHMPQVGWFCAFARAGKMQVTLAELAQAHQRLPDGPWKGSDTPQSLLTSLPVFTVLDPDGNHLTEPAELMRVPWGDAGWSLCLLDSLSDWLALLTLRGDGYLEILTEWHRTGPPEAGFVRVCHQYAALYNHRFFLEAYKLLEIRWMSEEGNKRELLQGLMQLSVGLHQITSGKYAVTQLEEAYSRIRTHQALFPAPTMGRFIKRLEKVIGLFMGYGADNFRQFDLGLFPRLWLDSPWRLLLHKLGRR